jgi:hypothetical protein
LLIIRFLQDVLLGMYLATIWEGESRRHKEEMVHEGQIGVNLLLGPIRTLILGEGCALDLHLYSGKFPFK